MRNTQVQKIYGETWLKFEKEFGHYFRSLYNIFKFIDSSKTKDKKFYTNIIRAQLSGQELLILFYNCIYLENNKFKPLIEKYALLKHIPAFVVADEIDLSFFTKDAFGSSYPSNLSPDKKEVTQHEEA
ncbi:hypothetical protein Misp06_03609 [Microbulbifer sp. NBRC 101763]|uniref:putative phage abortive infection protein n=1 Tax=Microbulbifer sp. NBRC 101763 TaxID=1113820 RepID=UPI0030B2ED9B